MSGPRFRVGTPDRSTARPPHPPRPHPGDERRQLPEQGPPAPGDERRPSIVPTPEDAEQIAGYEAANPTFLPEGFERGSIIVSDPFDETSGAHHTITQYWGSSSGEFISIVQNPDLDGIVGGESDSIAGVEGERAVYPALGGRTYELVGFFWRAVDMSYSISGSLTGSLTESDVREVSGSIAVE